jgi:hypothetical protein
MTFAPRLLACAAGMAASVVLASARADERYNGIEPTHHHHVSGRHSVSDWAPKHKARIHRALAARKVSKGKKAPRLAHSCGGHLARIAAHSGATACVHPRARATFQRFVHALEGAGAQIKFMGGYRPEDYCSKRHMHGCGLALDINQYARNVVRPGLPRSSTQLARQFGLLHGAVWGHPDTGHFEVLGGPRGVAWLDQPQPTVVARRRDVLLPASPRPLLVARTEPTAKAEEPIEAVLPLSFPLEPVFRLFRLLFETPKTAVYDIRGHTVYMPDGTKLEAHSGLGRRVDDPTYVHVRGHGPTPPNEYRLVMRERPFHGVKALRLLPIDQGKMFGRDGILAHSYLRRGGRGQSGGCVAFRDYKVFLTAFLHKEIERVVVVSKLDGADSAKDLVIVPTTQGGQPSARRHVNARHVGRHHHGRPRLARA